MVLFDIAANLRAPGQLQLHDCTHPSPLGSLESYLSRRMPVRWHAAELTVIDCCYLMVSVITMYNLLKRLIRATFLSTPARDVHER